MPGEDSSNQGGDEFFVRKSEGSVLGPFDADAIRMMLESGRMEATAELSQDKESWSRVGEYDEFAEYAEESEADDGDAPLPKSSDDKGGPAPSLGEESESADDAPLPTMVGDSPSDTGGPGLQSSDDSAGASDDGGEVDLPTPKSSGGDEDDGGGIDLPTPASSDSEPETSEGPTVATDAPDVGGGAIDLPSPESEQEDDEAASDQATVAADAPDLEGGPDLGGEESEEEPETQEATIQADAPDLGGDDSPALPTSKPDADDEDGGARKETRKGHAVDAGDDSPELPVSTSESDEEAGPQEPTMQADAPDLGGGDSPELPTAKSDSPAPPEASDSGGAPPDLPTSEEESGDEAGAELPTPKGDSDSSQDAEPELPASKEKQESDEDEDFKVQSGAPLPTADETGADFESESGAIEVDGFDLDDEDDEEGPDLPASAESADLPASAEGDELPASAEGDGLPASAEGDELPASAEGDELPASAEEDELPASAEGDELPASAEEEGLPTSNEVPDVPESAEPSEPGEAAEPDLGAEDDLLSDEEEDLFADAGGDDAGVGDEEDDLFGDAGGGDDEDDLFAEADESGDEDLFADEPEDDLFEDSPEPAGEEDDDQPVLEGDDLSLVDEGVDVDDESIEPGPEIDEEPSADTPSEPETGPEEDEEEALEIDEAAMRDTGHAGAEQPARGMEPEPASEVEAREEPAKEKAPEETDQEDGLGTGVIAAIALVLLAVGGGGAAYYAGLFESSKDTKKKKTKKTTEKVTVALDGLSDDTHRALRKVVDRGLEGSLGGKSRGRFLTAASLYLGRYSDDAVSERASSIASKLEGVDSPSARLGRGAWTALRAELETAEKQLEPVFEEGGDQAYYGRLAIGMGYALMAVQGAEKVERDSGWGDDEEPETPGLAAGSADVGTGSTDAGGASEADAGEGASGETGSSGSDSPVARRARRALEHLAKARSIASDRAAPLYWMGRSKEARRNSDAALKDYQKGVEKQPNHVASRLRMAQLHFAAGRLDKVQEQTKAVLEQFSGPAASVETAEAYHMNGEVLVARNKHADAIESFTKSLKQDPGRGETIRELADAYEKTGKYKQALQFFRSQQKKEQKNPEILLGMVRAHMGLERWQDAINALERGEDEFPDDARFSYYLGKLHRERGAFSDARQAMKRAVKIDPSLVRAYGALTQLSWKLDKDPRKSDEYVRKIVANPDKIDASVARDVADYYALREKREMAERWYEEALEREPNSWPSQLALSQYYLKVGKPKEARSILEGARESGVEDLRLSAYLADAYRQLSQYDRAVQAIDTVIQEKSKNPKYLFIRGRIHFARGNYDTAQRDFNKAYELDSQYYRARFFVGRTRFEQGDYKTAIQIFREVLDYESGVGEYHHWMGRAFEKQKRYKDALTQYEKATELDANYGERHPEVFVQRARVLIELERPDEAREQVEKALEIDPDSAEARLAMGEAEFKSKNYEAAIEHFREALEEKPEVAEAQYKIGQALIYQEKKREGASHLQKAVKYGYEDPEIYQTLGYVYKELGKKKLAVESFKSYLQEAKEAGEELPVSKRREMLRQVKELTGQ